MKEEDSIAAWCLDDAVTWFGITIENALKERVKVGYGKNETWKPKYTLALLLHKDFRLPPPPPEPDFKVQSNPFAGLMSWLGRPNSPVKRYVYVPPAEQEPEKMN